MISGVAPLQQPRAVAGLPLAAPATGQRSAPPPRCGDTQTISSRGGSTTSSTGSSLVGPHQYLTNIQTNPCHSDLIGKLSTQRSGPVQTSVPVISSAKTSTGGHLHILLLFGERVYTIIFHKQYSLWAATSMCL